MVEIIPAIMPRSFGDVREGVERVLGFVDAVQIDVMDGFFVPSASWPYNEKREDQLLPFVNGSEELPFVRDIDYEIDLMVEDPQKETIRWMCAGASRVVFHIESIGAVAAPELIASIRAAAAHSVRGDDSRLIRGHELGVAINIDTPNEALEELISKVDFVQCMGIADIGYQGEPFDERVIKKIIRLREKYPDVIISVDGGVNRSSVPSLIEAGAQRLVVGSAIWTSGDIEETINTLRSL